MPASGKLGGLSAREYPIKPTARAASRVDVPLMTIGPIRPKTGGHYARYGVSRFHLTKTTSDFAKISRMYDFNERHFPVTAHPRDENISASELHILRDVLKLLPTGVTVQDEDGEFVLMNDAAGALLEAAARSPSASQLDDRRDTCIELLHAGRPAVLEEAIASGAGKQVFLTAHRPIEIAGRRLLISSTTDISEQKAFEDHLFRAAYYDELTGLPTRRVIEHRVESLLKEDDGRGRFALAFLDVDNFKHINDYYGHAAGDALLVEMAKRLGLDLRESDILSRISGDEFVLLLNPIESVDEVKEFIHFILQRLKAPFFIDQSEMSVSIPNTAKATTCCARTPTSRCTASRTPARARPRSSIPAWSARRWRA